MAPPSKKSKLGIVSPGQMTLTKFFTPRPRSEEKFLIVIDEAAKSETTIPNSSLVTNNVLQPTAANVSVSPKPHQLNKLDAVQHDSSMVVKNEVLNDAENIKIKIETSEDDYDYEHDTKDIMPKNETFGDDYGDKNIVTEFKWPISDSFRKRKALGVDAFEIEHDKTLRMKQISLGETEKVFPATWSPFSELSFSFTEPAKIPTKSPEWARRGETPERKARYDALVEKYEQLNGKDKLRCMIKALDNPLLIAIERGWILADLDRYAGGPGNTELKLDAERAGNEVSMRAGACLVRRGPSGGKTDYCYELHFWRVKCPDCGEEHRWRFIRGLFDACVMGRFDDPNNEFGMIDALLNGDDSSHLCHNSACSDPFHMYHEPRGVNLRRNNCRKPVKGFAFPNRDCTHSPRCRAELGWYDVKEHWKVVMEECANLLLPKTRPGWRCTAGCGGTKHGRQGAVFDNLMHWSSGCKRGGTWRLVWGK